MRTNRLGRTALEVSRVCLGTMTFGEQNTEAEAHAQLALAVERGINFIDTAEMYPVPTREETTHRTESYIGTWLEHQQREKVVIATKATGPSRGLKWIRGGPRLTRMQLREAVEASLRRLRTDYIDLYQLHWPERNTPTFGQTQFDPGQERPATDIRDQLDALAELVGEGKIRHIGVSNETPWGVCRFTRLSEEYGLPRIATIQNAYSLLNRCFEVGLAETCHHEGVSLLAYSSLAFGHLTGKYFDNPSAPGRLTRFPNFGQRYTKPNVLPATKEYVELARRHGLSPTVMALAYVMSRWFVGAVIIGATTLEQLEENLFAADVELDESLQKEID